MRLRAWLGASFWSPNDLAARAAVDVATGVYLPHYGFIMDVHANWTGAYAQTHYRTEVYSERDAEGRQVTRSREVPYTVWYPESGRHDGTHSTLVCASQGLTQREADAIAPFDLNATERDIAGYLAGFVSELPAVAANDAWRSTGKGRIDAEVQADCAAMTEELRTYHWVMERFGQTLIWLPVWLSGYRYGERYHRVVMNGQTGKMAGERPVSARKVVVAILVVAIAVLLVVIAIHLRSA